MPVVIVLTVGFIVLLVIRNQIIQRKAVMGGNKVDAGPRATSAQIVQIAGAQQAAAKSLETLSPSSIHAPCRDIYRSTRPSLAEPADLIAAGPISQGSPISFSR
jgi:hypothetical protein